MKKFISVFLAAVLLAAVFFALPTNAKGENIVPADGSSEFSHTDLWSNRFGGELSAAPVLKEGWSNNYCLAFSRRGLPSWVSPCIDLYPVLSKDLQERGTDTDYTVEFDVFFSGENPGESTILNALFRCSNAVSLTETANSDNTEFRFRVARYDIKTGFWYHIVTDPIHFAQSDVSGTQTWYFCFDSIKDDITGIYIDNFCVFQNSGTGTAGISAGYSGLTNVGIEGEVTAPPEDVILTPSPRATVPPVGPDATALPGENLLSKDDSEFESAQITWQPFGDADYKIGEGYSGNGLKMISIPYSWSSPAIDISPYITSPGGYSVGLAVKCEGQNRASNISLLIRGRSANSFLRASGENVLTSLSSAYGKTGEWFFISGQFTVTDEDIKNKNEWLLCLGSISEGTETLTIDNVQLIFGKPSNLKKTGDNGSDSETNAFSNTVELDPSIKNAFYISLAASVCTAAAVIAFKIKKSGKRSRNV